MKRLTDMKRVSFPVAKALKEDGYPQLIAGIGTSLWYTENGEFTDGCLKDRYVICPTYLEAWLWLWREKKISIELSYESTGWFSNYINYPYSDLEEAIEGAIKHLVENKLLK